MIGEECDLLSIASPFTYIARQKTLCYCTKVEVFFKEMLALNPLGLDDLRMQASFKLKEFNQIAREKKLWDQTAANLDSIKRQADKKEARELNARKHYPMGDKPVIQNIMNLI